VCTFTGAVNGAAGTTQIDTVTAGWFAIRTDPGHQPLRGTASASGAVSIIAAPALPAKKTCKKGFRLKTVKTKSGKKKKKCVRKKKGK
jgi:hypothetical protein